MRNIKKSKARKSTPDIGREIRHLGVMMEHVEGKVDLVAEQHGDMDEKINVLGQKLDGVVEHVGKLSADMTIVKEDIEFIKNSLKRKVDVEEFAALERRVATLESRR